MEVVAQAKHPARAGRMQCVGYPPERLPAVVRRQHLPVAGEEACLFKVQVGHQQRVLARPEQRAAAIARIGDDAHLLTGERKGNHAPSLPPPPRFGKRSAMTDWTPYTTRARTWFESLRDR